MRVAAICGSLRSGSFNRSALRLTHSFPPHETVMNLV